jgi:hypothetical protein
VQQGSDWETCLRVSRNKPAPTLDVRISACTRILEQGDHESVKNRVLAYINRCSANTHKGDLDRQSPIATEAIRLDPSRAALKAMMFAFTGERPWRSNFVDTLISSEGISISLLLITRKVIRLHSKGESSLLFPLDKQLQGDI